MKLENLTMVTEYSDRLNAVRAAIKKTQERVYGRGGPTVTITADIRDEEGTRQGQAAICEIPVNMAVEALRVYEVQLVDGLKKLGVEV